MGSSMEDGWMMMQVMGMDVSWTTSVRASGMDWRSGREGEVVGEAVTVMCCWWMGHQTSSVGR